MAGVGAPGSEMSDEPHIPSVTIVHRYCILVHARNITGLRVSIVCWNKKMSAETYCVVKLLGCAEYTWIGLIFVLGTLYPWRHHPISL